MEAAVLAVLILLPQDPAEQLRRQELALRLEDLAVAGRFEALSKALFRELRGKRIDASALDVCWKIVSLRRWDGRLEEFVAAWDKAAAAEAPAPGPALFRARLESLFSKPKPYRARLEDASKKFPGEPAILWPLAEARFAADDHAGAASALEELGPLKGFFYDPDDFHRMLARSYAETGRRPAAVEHLRALRGDGMEVLDRAALAMKCGLPEEAVRWYRLAISEDEDRISVRLGLIRALQMSGEEAGAADERRRMFLVDGKVQAARVEDYFFLLPADGRVEEIRRTLRELLDPEAATIEILSKVPADDRGQVAASWEKAATDARSWLILSRMRRAWGHRPEQILEALEKGEKQFPADPLLCREKIEPLGRLSRFGDVADAYARLVELDPDAKKSGARPYAVVQDAIRGLVVKKDLGAALRLGVLALSEPGVDDAARAATRAAMKPACETSGVEFWAEVRKLKLPRPDAKTELVVKTHLIKLSDDEFAVRSEASRGLQKAGLPAIPQLLERIDDEDAEVRSKAREIIRAILSE
ncbi:MAG: hypothetical protein HY293_21800 [Planctomycetes bacterium]|nr:hypothetical protein [Planctomycetota bacterium]